MIKTKITVRNITADYPFSGDPAKTWFCEIIDSNLGTDGNPTINYVSNGRVNLTCLPRHFNSTLDVVFQEDYEKAEVTTMEQTAMVTEGMSPAMLSALAKVSTVSKKVAAGFVGLIALSFVFAFVNYFTDLTGFLDSYQKYNAANGAKIVDSTVKRVVKHVSTDVDAFYNSPGIKEINRREEVNIEKLFTLANDGVYIMRDVFKNEDGEILAFEYDDAEDRCEDLGGSVPTAQIHEDYIMNTMYMKIAMVSGVPEWTSTSRGAFSDDYIINQKAGDAPDNSYTRNGTLYGDDGDVLTAARCMIDSADFIEEKETDDAKD